MKQFEIRSLGDLVHAVRSAFPKQEGHSVWYRGHPKSHWKLVPSVYRHYTPQKERRMTSRFRLAAPTRYPNSPGRDDFARWLCLMQHFGLPTRLLDWTESPLIAAYFALDHDPHAGDKEVWCLSPGDLNRLRVGSCSLEFLGSKSNDHILRPAFVEEEQTEDVVAVQGQEIDLRMTVQQGVFTIHGNARPLEDWPDADQFLARFVIPGEISDQLRADLWLLGIRRSLLFPDIENLAIELAEEWKRIP